MALSDFFTRRRPDAASATPETGGVQVPTKALRHFLTTLEAHTQPVVLDLGPVVGRNVTFFGEHLGCRIVVEDLFADLDRHAHDGRAEGLAEFFADRLAHEEASVDGILCWDIFDYLDPEAATALAGRLTRLLRPGGVVLAFFATTAPVPGALQYTKHLVIDEATLERRPYEAACGKRRPVLTREIERMFGPLRVKEQFLLKAHVREVLFKKPAEPAAVASDLSAAVR